MSAAILPPDERADLTRVSRLAFTVGLLGVGVCLVGALLPGTRVTFFRAWLVAFNLGTGLALGSLVVLMLQYLTGGVWGVVLRRPLEAATRTLPLMAVLFVPLAFGLPDLYAWARPSALDDPDLIHKAPYLNVPFFLIRAVIYFALWNGLAWTFSAWSKRQDEQGGPSAEIHSRCVTLSAPGMMLYVVSITFASIDWVMSLEPHWYSTIYGAMFGMGQVLSGFAFAVAVVALLVARKPLADLLGRQQLRDLGSLLMAFIMVWAYLAFMQFLLIWAGNLPEEVPWYVARLAGPWKFVALALVVLHYAIPFAILLSANLRSSRTALVWVASLVVVMRVADLLWLIVPAFDHHSHSHAESSADASLAFFGPLLYAAALAAVGGLWLGEYLRQLAGRPLLPVGVTIEKEEAHHG
jgi:hypothetical protein